MRKLSGVGTPRSLRAENGDGFSTLWRPIAAVFGQLDGVRWCALNEPHLRAVPTICDAGGHEQSR